MAKVKAKKGDETKGRKLRFREMFRDGKVYVIYSGANFPKRLQSTNNAKASFKLDSGGFWYCTDNKWPVRREALKKMGYRIAFERQGAVMTLDEIKKEVGAVGSGPIDVVRVSTGFEPLDLLLGGKHHEKIGFGIPRGTLTVLNGNPGAGKSTLLSQIALNLSNSKITLYVTSEETPEQIYMRLRRMCGGKFSKRQRKYLRICCTSDIDVAAARVRYADADVLIVDSIQGFHPEGMHSKMKDWKRSFEMVRNYVKNLRPKAVAVAVSQVTKDGEMAGPRAFEHDCDINLSLTGTGKVRELEPTKNRYNETIHKVLVRMTATGLSFDDAQMVDRPDFTTGSSAANPDAGDGEWRDMV